MKRRKISAILAYPMPWVEVALYHSKKKLKRDLKSRGISVDLSNTPGQTFRVKLKSGPIDIVLLDMKKCKAVKLWEQFAVLAHESAHIVNAYMEMIGEEEPGEEEAAYLMQAVSGCLFDAHIRYLKKKTRGVQPWEKD